MEGTARIEGNLMFPDHHFHIKKCTFGEQARNRLDKTKSRQQRDEIVKCVCALLNSGGGVISVEIENKDYAYKSMGLGQDLEKALDELVKPSVIQDLIEFRQFGKTMQLYVKTWCPDSQRARICSVDSGLRERSLTSTSNTTFVRKPRKIEDKAQINLEAQQFYDEETAQPDQILDFGESESVELKSFTGEKLETRLKEAVSKYVSAFANTNGGFLFIGVDDKTKRVVGCGKGMDAQKIKQMIRDISDKAKTRAFHLSHCSKSDWSVGFKVIKVGEKPEYIIALRIPAFCCVVFEEDPKCWHVENGAIVKLNPESWLRKMQLSDPDDELTKRFKKVLSVKDSPSKCRPVYSTQKISQLQERIFSVKKRPISIINESIPQKLSVKYQDLLLQLSDENRTGVLIMSTSWAADINLPRNREIICEVLLISAGSYPTLFSWVEEESAELWQHVTETAFHLKQKLVNLGGFTGRLCVIPQLVNSQTGELFKKKKTDDAPLYPYSYRLGDEDEVVALLRSLTIVLLSFSSPVSDKLGCEFFSLLTKDQFKILKNYSGIKHLFIHGPPGSGKTLIAMEKIMRIKNSDCTNILYLCENTGLRNFVRKQSICLCETRADFLKKTKEDFPTVEHIIVDEGQNFRVDDGDWYQKAKSLIEGKSGFFWIFLDYCQRCHTQDTGLPHLDGQANVYLSEVVRNSKAIFRKMSRLIGDIEGKSKPEEKEHLKKMRENFRLSHSFKGTYVHEKNVFSVEEFVVSVIKNLLTEGHSATDIAVLFTTLGELDEMKDSVIDNLLSLQFGKAEDLDQDLVVLDTICAFSGLERNIVIVVYPFTEPLHPEHWDNILLSGFSRARIHLYVVKKWTIRCLTP